MINKRNIAVTIVAFAIIGIGAVFIRSNKNDSGSVTNSPVSAEPSRLQDDNCDRTVIPKTLNLFISADGRSVENPAEPLLNGSDFKMIGFDKVKSFAVLGINDASETVSRLAKATRKSQGQYLLLTANGKTVDSMRIESPIVATAFIFPLKNYALSLRILCGASEK
jgi:hypothetical protein